MSTKAEIPPDIEELILSKVIAQPDAFTEVMSSCVDTNHFRAQVTSDVFDFILEFRVKHGELPSDAVVLKHTGFKSVAAPEPMSYYTEQIINRAAYYTAKDGLNEAQTNLRGGKIAEAVESLEECARAARVELSHQTHIDRIQDVDPRKARYLGLESQSGIMGIAAPWEDITLETQGWKRGEYGLVTARTGVGKTLFTILMAHHAWLQGYKVCYVSMEMTTDIIHVRHDALAAEVPLGHLYKATLSPAQKKRFDDTMEELRELGGFDVVGHNMSASMGQIEAVVEITEPDILFVDGAYMVVPTQKVFSGNRTEKYEAIAKEMSQLAERSNIPVFNSLQMNRDQKKDATEADAANIYGGDAWAHNADYIMHLIQTKQDKLENTMRLSCSKHRNGAPFASRIQWDWEDLDFAMLEYESGSTTLGATAAAAVMAPGSTTPSW